MFRILNIMREVEIIKKGNASSADCEIICEARLFARIPGGWIMQARFCSKRELSLFCIFIHQTVISSVKSSSMSLHDFMLGFGKGITIELQDISCKKQPFYRNTHLV